MNQNKALFRSTLDLIGNTPMQQLQTYNESHIYAKLEMCNPTHSIKDRIAHYMIEQAEKKGLLNEHSTIVEASSGNTGASVAMVGQMKGYPVVLTAPDKASREKVALMQAYGADVRICPSSAAIGEYDNYITTAERLAHNIEGSYFVNQYNDEGNILAHYYYTGPEIWQQMNGAIDYLVACGGSGGTISGISRYLKEQNPDIQTIMADPLGSVYYGYFHRGYMDPNDIQDYLIEGAGKDSICDCMDFSVIDNAVQYTDQQAIDALKQLVQQDGVLAGGSSGGNLYVAHQIASQLDKPANIVVIFPDCGLKYLSTLFV